MNAPLALELVQQSRAARRLARLLLGVFSILPFLLVLVPWQQYVPAMGRVIAFSRVERLQGIKAPLDGRVVQWHVQEGQPVREGERVADMSDNDPDFLSRLREQRTVAQVKLDAALARVKALDDQIASLEDARRLAIAAAEERVGMAQARVVAAERAVEAARAAARVARLDYERQELLSKEGVVSVRVFQMAEYERARADAELVRSEAALDAAKHERSSFEAERDRIGREIDSRLGVARSERQTALSDAAAARADLLRAEVSVNRQQRQTILAPRAGTIFRILIGAGTEIVKAGEPIAQLVPETDARAVEVWIRGNDVPLVHPGRHVRLQFEGWPAIQFVGWPSVAVGTFGGEVAFVDPTDDGTGRFRVVVVPEPGTDWPPARFLRQGARAKGWVLLNRVRLGYEIWRQVNGFPPVLSKEEPRPPEQRSTPPD